MRIHPDERPKPRDWDGRPLGPGILIEEKHDGHRLTIVKRPNGDVEAWPRKAHLSVASELAWHEELWARIWALPPATALDGELSVDGLRADQVTSVLKSRAPRPSELTFTPFAVPWWCGADLRLSSFAVRDAWIRECGFEPPRRLPAVGEVTPERLRVLAVECEIEGFVLKQQHWSGWWKVKRVRTADCVVTGTVPGKGKHAGRHGALTVALRKRSFDQPKGWAPTGDYALVEVASVGKGGDDQWRDLPERKLLGRVCEVSYEGTQSRGRLKFSAFVRWRDDKPAEECTMDQVVGV